jgi:uncharacterized surface protein with fasciclin (FAS1) repeats
MQYHQWHCQQRQNPQRQQRQLLLLLLLAVMPSLIDLCTGLRHAVPHQLIKNQPTVLPQQQINNFRSLQQVVPAAQAAPTANSTTAQTAQNTPAAVYPSLQVALNAAVEAGSSGGGNATASSNGPRVANITTFAAAVKAADLITGTTNVAWTLLAPTNKALEKKLPALGGTVDSLLANRTLLMQILSYHLIPSGAYNSSSLREGLLLTTGELHSTRAVGSLVEA